VAEGKSEKNGRRDTYARLSRRIATLIVILGIVYLIGVAVISVVPQVFWPRAGRVDPEVTCTEGLRDLRAQMLARAGEHVASGGSEDDAWMRPWLARWDLQHRGLEDRCQGEDRETWVRLAQMRERMEGSLERFDDEEGELAREVDRALAHRR
jgi:hypothetical protein